jgi:MraZ protein
LDEVYIIKSLGRGCLVAMTQDVLQSLGSNAQAKSPTTADHSAFQDTLFANAVICPIDSQGRMVLPDELCRFAGIEKEAVLTGAGEKFNIWNPAGWQRFQESVAPTYATILKSLGL